MSFKSEQMHNNIRCFAYYSVFLKEIKNTKQHSKGMIKSKVLDER